MGIAAEAATTDGDTASIEGEGRYVNPSNRLDVPATVVSETSQGPIGPGGVTATTVPLLSSWN
jgi:hypothetical protein